MSTSRANNARWTAYTPLRYVSATGYMGGYTFENAASLTVGNDVEVINPFSHPRVLFSDFTVGEKLFQYALKDLLGNKLMSPAPAIIVHPMEKTEGGLTMIEVRALKELAFGAGARDCIIYVGKELSPHEINFNSIKEQIDEQ